MTETRILIITSDPDLGTLLSSTILRPAGYQVSLARDRSSAETSIRAFPPDLALITADLEDGSGLEFADRMARQFITLPIILIGEAQYGELPRQAMQIGAVDYLSLPLSDQQVLQSVQRGLERRERWHDWLNRRTREDTNTLRRRLDVLEALGRIGRSVTASLDLDHVLTAVVDAAVRMTNAEEGSLLILDEENGELYMRAARNFQDEFVRTFRLPIKDTLAGEVVRTGKSVILDQGTPQKIKTSYLVRTLMYVPLKVHGRVIGVLGVDNRESDQPFLEHHLTLVSALADYAAIAIENARLYNISEVERQKLETILTRIGDGVIVISSNQRIVLANAMALQAFGVDEEDVSGRRVDEIFHHEQLLVLLSGQPAALPFRGELALEDGRTLHAQYVQIPEVGFAVTMQDITHLKELDRIKNDFVNTVSHDLRSPLTAILGYAELIERVGPVTEQQRDFVRRVQISVRNITSLINDLLELGRIESGFDARKEFVPLAVIVQYSADGLSDSIAEKQHRLEFEILDQRAKVFGDPVRLRQMLDALLGNAIRYMSKGGQIRVCLRAETDQVILQISDTGPGIPPADQPYIFDKFYRASNISGDIPGSGLGLAIVKSIVDNHQGRVWVDSSLGKGATFTVVLPIADDVL